MRVVLRSVILLAVSLMVFSYSPGAAAFPDTTARVQIVSFPTWKTDQDDGRVLFEHIERWLSSRGILVREKAEWALWCDASPVSAADSELIILNIGLGHTLPRRVIELGTKAEVFYDFLPEQQKAKLPPEGAWVREMMSEEFLYQFVALVRQESVVVKRSEMIDRLEVLLECMRKRIERSAS